VHHPEPQHEHDDDRPVGRVLTRREVLALLGGSGAALAVGLALPDLLAQGISGTPTPTATAIPGCIVRPELAQGPFFLDRMLNRVDVRVDSRDGSIKPGMPLRLVFRVSDVTGGVCTPLPDAVVDIWHCDADGVYSGVRDGRADTTGQIWLRGYQVTDARGMAEFLTIVPGWYSGRAVHIHFKIRTDPAAARGHEFVSQLFFDPAQIAPIYSEAPYTRRGLPDVPNERDFIYRQGGALLLLDLRPLTAQERSAHGVAAGYAAVFSLGLDRSG
jgi:protocatechuate 3,4-dioxygenase beta subunit